MTGIKLLISDCLGVHIPKQFVLYFTGWEDISAEDMQACIKGPSSEDYWDAWDMILTNAHHKDNDGHVWRLHQDGDLFAYCEDLMTAEERAAFFE